MKIFISWSGEDSVSQKVAIELSKWLPMIIQTIEPWVSTGISSGDRWNEKINKSLSDSGMGIICVSKNNLNAPWLNFEAGAIAKGITNNKVIPLLINLKPSDLSNSPLAQFHAKYLEKDSVKELLVDINSMCERSMPDERLVTLFERCWDDFYEPIETILSQTPVKKEEKEKSEQPFEEILEEVLSLTREIRNDMSYRVGKLERKYEIISNDLSICEYDKKDNANKHNIIYKDEYINNSLMEKRIKRFFDEMDNKDMNEYCLNDKMIKVINEIYVMKKDNVESSIIVDQLSKKFNVPKKIIVGIFDQIE